MQLRNIEKSFSSLTSYIFSNLGATIEAINSDVSEDTYTLSVPVFELETVPNLTKGNVLTLVLDDVDKQGKNDYGDYEAIINFTIFVTYSMPQSTSSKATIINKILLRYMDALDLFFFNNPTLGDSCTLAAIDRFDKKFDDSRGYIVAECQALVKFSYME